MRLGEKGPISESRYIKHQRKQSTTHETSMNFLRTLLFAAFIMVAGLSYSERKADIKTNLIPDAALSPNLGLEFKLAKKWSLDLTGELNLWSFDEHKWKHWLVQPEARYWFCEPFVKSFLGIHAIGGEFNVGKINNGINFLGTDFSKLRDYRYEGWAAGGGIAYGYALPLSKHFNMEFEIGVGYVYVKYKKFSCAECSRELGDGHHNYFGPTKAAINLVYLF